MPDTFFPMIDPEFGAPHPLAAAGDPVTSQLAANEIAANGTLNRHCKAVLAVVKACPGLTSAEYAERYARFRADRPWVIALDRSEFGRRLPDLEKYGKVKKSGQRECSVGGRTAVTWEAC